MQWFELTSIPANPASVAGGLRILVPLDDSPQAQRVLVYAVALASAAPGRIKLIRATDVEPEISLSRLARDAQRLIQGGVSVEWSVVGGVDAVSAIQAEQRAWRPDLIALATTKSSRFDRWLNGSVTREVVRSASVYTPPRSRAMPRCRCSLRR